MRAIVYAMMLTIAGTAAALAQPAAAQTPGGSSVSTVSPDVVKDLAPTGKVRAERRASGEREHPAASTAAINRFSVPVWLG